MLVLTRKPREAFFCNEIKLTAESGSNRHVVFSMTSGKTLGAVVLIRGQEQEVNFAGEQFTLFYKGVCRKEFKVAVSASKDVVILRNELKGA